MVASGKTNGDSHIIEEFIRDLESTSEQVGKLLEDVRNSEVDFAAIKTELRILCDNVKELSIILKDGDGGASLITKVALLEQNIRQVEKGLEKLEQNNVVDNAGKWQMKIALLTGTFGFLASLILLLIQMFVK